MKTSPFRKATADVSFQVFNLTSAFAVGALFWIPPWRWFGIGHSLVELSSGVEPWQGADVAAVVWAVAVSVTVLWTGSVMSHRDEQRRGL